MYLCRALVASSYIQGRRSKDGSECYSRSSSTTGVPDTHTISLREPVLIIWLCGQQQKQQAAAYNQMNAAAAGIANGPQVGILGVKGIPYQGDQMAKIVEVLGTPERKRPTRSFFDNAHN